ncbi:TrmH family RNA methyltransferase [Candidatus Peregrinibacteria bacterium]|jgi:23S rRNA (guanosine2251-2'-O)-methyltransferase|nr:TrmH family RNA methyltransferase [Candidatus Peregrinibacteria bacterium]MBT4147660.1 TrmH family RNA methyltransferase [Candidatus Peregrinibacteria bacterium]MBT4366284.1 TrmH family RNA methyltransferase [Candidatus Peregrinibacteria bacterium]MBT4455788.1 TrmH family RNA methyltransferase [Candidatus Peregrinibacteria bacterium]
MAHKYPIYVILENIRSLYNIGAMFRTSDGVGIEKVFLCGITGQPPKAEISKTALGAEESVDWEYEEEACDVIDRLKGEGISIIGVELADDAENFWDFEAKFPVCLVFGHEVEGVSAEVLAKCDKKVFVPMNGLKESLNVEACFSTVTYEFLRKFLNAKN